MATPSIKAKRYWAVHYGNGHIDPYSIRETRRQAVEAFCILPHCADWPDWKKKGCRPVKILVSPNDKLSGAAAGK